MMIVNIGLYVAIVTCVLLALVAGLLVTVGVWLYEFRKNYNKMPALAEQLANQLMAARNAMDGLKKAARESVPELERKLTDVNHAMQDLRFLTARAEETLTKLDHQVAARPEVVAQVIPADVQAAVETMIEKKIPASAKVSAGAPALGAGGVLAARVAVSNGQAASVLAEMPDTQPDPLEELLAGLADAGEVAMTKAGLVGNDGDSVGKTPRVKSQAELDLRAKLAS